MEELRNALNIKDEKILNQILAISEEICFEVIAIDMPIYGETIVKI